MIKVQQFVSLLNFNAKRNNHKRHAEQIDKLKPTVTFYDFRHL